MRNTQVPNQRGASPQQGGRPMQTGQMPPMQQPHTIPSPSSTSQVIGTAAGQQTTTAQQHGSGDGKPHKRKGDKPAHPRKPRKVLVKTRRAIMEALHHMGRHVGMSVGACLTIAISLFIVGVFCIGTTVLNSAMTDIESAVVIRAFIADGAAEEDVNAFRSEVESWSEVDSVDMTTKEQAYEEYSTSGQADDEAIDALGDNNPFPASFRISLKNADDVKAIADRIKSDETFAKIADMGDVNTAVSYAEDTVEPLLDAIGNIRIGAVGVIVFFLLIAIVLMSNSIRMSVNTRSREIRIMRLVGSQNDYIRRPFVAEGIIQSIIGAVFAIVGLLVVQMVGMPAVANSISFLNMTVPTHVYVIIYVGITVIGILLGFIVSSVSIRRFLKL